MAKPVVLLIDDDRALLGLMQSAFQRADFMVHSAQDGAAGEKLFRVALPDLVVTDILMPNREGIETIIEMKRLRPSVKILAISGGGRIGVPDFLEIAAQLGADATLPKPFRMGEVVGRGKALLGMPPELLAS